MGRKESNQTKQKGWVLLHQKIDEPQHEISNNVVQMYVRPAKAQTSLRIRAVWSEPLLVTWIFYEC